MEFQNDNLFKSRFQLGIGWKICLIVSKSNQKSQLIDTVDKKFKGFLRECLEAPSLGV